MNKTQLICLTLLCVFLSSWAQIALKQGMSSGSVQALLKSDGIAPAFILHAVFAPFVILGLTLYVLSTLLWLLVLAKADVSYAYPFVSLGFVVITLYAHFAMTEPLSTLKMGGIALITVGVFCVAKS